MTVMDFPSSPVNGQTTTDGRYYFDSSVGSSGAWRSAPLPVGGLPAGSVIQWSAPTLPTNWLLCDGSAVSRSVYSSLFAVVGTTYGAGDGSTTFNLPDIPNGSSAGVLNLTRSTSSQTIQGSEVTINDASTNVSFKAGRSYRFSIQLPAVINGSARLRVSFYVGSTVIDRAYFWTDANGTNRYFETVYTPSVDGVQTVQAGAMRDQGTGDINLYSDPTSNRIFTVEDLGEGTASTVRQRHIIKASAGWTAGDSELATRLGAVETANAGANKAGLVPIVPTSVSVGGGSASVNSAGIVTVTSAYDIKLNGVFSSTYKNYLVLVNYNSCTSTPSIYMKLTTAGTVNSTGYVYSTWRVNASGAGYYMGSTNSTGGVYITEADASQGSGSSRSQVTIFNPFESTYSVINAHGHGGYAAQGWNMILTSGIHDTSSRDGFQLTHGTTQATGTVQVYGYR